VRRPGWLFIETHADWCVASEVQGDSEGLATPIGADIGDVDPNSLLDINFDDGAPHCLLYT